MYWKGIYTTGALGIVVQFPIRNLNFCHCVAEDSAYGYYNSTVVGTITRLKKLHNHFVVVPWNSWFGSGAEFKVRFCGRVRQGN